MGATRPLLSNVSAPLGNGDTVEEAAGLCLGVIQETITLSPAAASFPVSLSIPSNAVVVMAQLKLNGTISATTAVKVGLGKSNGSADPDKYALTSNLTAQTAGGMVAHAVLASQDDLYVTACDTNGAAAGSIGGTDQTATVRIVYRYAAAL